MEETPQERAWRRIRRQLNLRQGTFELLEKVMRDGERPCTGLLCCCCHTCIRTITVQGVTSHITSLCHRQNAELQARPRPQPSAASYDACTTRQSVQSVYNKLRRTYIDVCYEQSLNEIRKEIGDRPIWIGVDETTDVQKRKIVNFMVAPLRCDRPGIPRLLNCDMVDIANAQNMVNYILETLTILWPNGVHAERVLMFASDGAAYMTATAGLLRGIFAKMIHVTCAAHGLHLVAESVRQLHPQCNDRLPLQKVHF